MNNSNYDCLHAFWLNFFCKLSLITVMIGLSSALSGCVDEFSAEQIESLWEINLSGTIDQQNLTRAGDAGFVAGDMMGVYIVDYQNGRPDSLMIRGNRANNYSLTLNEETQLWGGVGSIYWKDSKTAVDIYGYYPYENAIESVKDHIFYVQADQREKGGDGTMSGYEKSDFLWAKKTNVQPTKDLILLDFEHRMAGIKVILKQGDGFEGDEWNKMKRVITIENTYLSARIDLSTGIATPTKVDRKSIIAAPQGDDIYRAVIIPQTISGNSTFIGLTIDGTYYQYIPDVDIKFQQGKMYVFSLSVDRDDSGDYLLNLIDEDIEPWENDNSSHNFEASAYTIIHCPQEGTLAECIRKSGKGSNIINLKITGKLNDKDFSYIRGYLKYLKSLNIYETTTYGSYFVKKDDPNNIYSNYRENVMPDDALRGMSNLKHLILPKHLETIGSYALFEIGLANNSTLIIPDGVKVLGDRCMASIEQGNLIIPDSLEYIGTYAFSSNNCIFDVPLNNNIWYIGDGAFYESHRGKGYFRLPEFVMYIGRNCFHRYGAGLEGEINIPASINVVPSSAFFDMKFANGVNLKFHNDVTCIDAMAFYRGQFNNKIVWPVGLVSIGNKSFQSCNFQGGMEDLPESLSNLGEDAFASSKNLPEHLKLPLYLSRVSSGSFYNTNIQSLDISGNTEIIEANAFSSCRRLTRVKIGKYVETIGMKAFSSCDALTNITCLNTEPPVIEDNTFHSCDIDHIILEVPEKSVNQYRTAKGWKKFKYITPYHELAVSLSNISCLDKGITRNMIVRSQGEWEVTDCPEWCHLSKTSSDIHTTEITVRVDKSDYSREGQIVFRLKDSGYETTCLVSQYISDYSEDKEIILQQATEGNKQIPLFIVGDGFTAQQISDGTYLRTMNDRMEEFFAIEPFKTYRNHFTVVTAFAVSPEEGISSSQTIVVNKFNTKESYYDFTCDYGALRKYIKDVSPTIDDNIGSSIVLIAMNQNIFGGTTQIFDDGLTVSLVPESPYDYPYDTRGLVQHYAGGKGFGRLAEESISHKEFIRTCSCPNCNTLPDYYSGQAKGWYGNISLTATMNKVPWSHLIFDSHYSDIVDVFEGGLGHSRGVYRSESQSCMSTYIQYYNTISRELIVRRIMELTGEDYSFEKFISRDSREGLPQ